MKEEVFEFIPPEDVPNEFPRVRNWLNFEKRDEDYNPSGGESMTIPDQSMTMTEILSRYARGLPIRASMREDPVYDEFNEFPDTSHMDLAEVEELRVRYQQELHEVNKRVREEKEKENAKRRKEAHEKIYEQLKKEKEAQNDSKTKDVS